MKISVIVPVYNVRDYIIECIDSIVNQTFKDFEIIVVNDGTKDDSIKLIEEHYDDNRIKIVYKKNGGLANARNVAIKYAKGEYLFFVDSDDFLETRALEKMYNKALENNYDIVFADYFKWYDANNYEEIPMISHFHSDKIKSMATSMPSAWGKLIKKDFYVKNKIEFLEGYIHEDNAIMPLLSLLTNSQAYLKEPLYYYRQREGSILNKNEYDKRFEDIFYVLSYLKEKFVEYGVFDEGKEELEYIYIEYLLHAANLRFLKFKEGWKNIKRVHEVMKKEFPKFRKNEYYKEENIKYKIVCNLFYYNQIKILNFILNKKRGKND